MPKLTGFHPRRAHTTTPAEDVVTPRNGNRVASSSAHSRDICRAKQVGQCCLGLTCALIGVISKGHISTSTFAGYCEGWVHLGAMGWATLAPSLLCVYRQVAWGQAHKDQLLEGAVQPALATTSCTPQQEDTQRHPDTSAPLCPTRITHQGLFLRHIPLPCSSLLSLPQSGGRDAFQ